MKEIGAYLKETRMGHGVTIEEASEDLNMTTSQLENIESGNTRSFRDVYQLKEYVHNYAKYLGLDPDQILDEFNDFLFEKTTKISLDDIKNAKKGRKKETVEEEKKIASPYTLIPMRRKSRMPYIVGGIVVIIILILIFLLFHSIRPTESRTSELKGIYEVEVVA